ncbi:MAG: hypothetical protein M3Q69_02215 [Acidobacteriota bacterium]|nr:hypothetical protein [Acidobacteriota bacterium]
MTLSGSDDHRALFEYFSSEYAQALQAFEAIESQAPTLALMGHTSELRQFLEQFIAMAARTRGEAVEKEETNFADWFGELIQKAQKLLAGVPQ